MSGTHLLRAATRPVSSWGNGGGETSEIARHPIGADGSWWWRVSIATITRDGGFTRFPARDRVLIPLDGALRLDVAGTLRDVPELGVFRFRGEDAVTAVDVTNPTQDLNVIVSRGQGRADVRIVAGDGSRVAAGPGQWLLVVALSDGVHVDTADVLAQHDVAFLQEGEEIVLHQGQVAVVTLSRVTDH